MKKIMFNDRYGLTEAVLNGRKTMTRRIIKLDELGEYNLANALKQDWGEVSIQAFIKNSARYQVGEVVAIAQAYSCVGFGDTAPIIGMDENDMPIIASDAGIYNKMFVRADLMPHQIRITNIRLERLRDISYDDILAEGISTFIDAFTNIQYYTFENAPKDYSSHKTAFRTLIDKVSGKGTWESNPFVFVYDFELVK